METLLALIPAFLLAGACVQAMIALGRARAGHHAHLHGADHHAGHPGDRLVAMLAVAAPLASLGCAIGVVSHLLRGGADIEVRLWNWMASSAFSVDIVFRADHLTAVMLSVITFIGSLIHLYSTAYMKGDPGYPRYFSYLNLFTFFMTILVMAGDLVLLFVGWEGVGLASYLLIGFWWSDAEKAKAGMKAFVVNRVGDAFFMVGAFLLWRAVGSLDLKVIRGFIESPEGAAKLLAPAGMFGLSLASGIALLLFMGATGKSAQIPLYVWLPDAMAGPTPVSALIHAATMVTAGIYLAARLNGLFALAPDAGAVVLVVASATCLLAASMALVQTDIKKVLAYSTVSQLGYMFIGVGAGAYDAGVFHLVTHAFFKACLFLGAGSVIHALHHEQDLRRMGGLRSKCPTTFRTMLIAGLSMAGVAPLAGFVSKDEILWKAWEHGGVGRLAWLLGSIAALCTAFYTGRLLLLAFGGDYRGETPKHEHGHGHDDHGHHAVAYNDIHESPKAMTLPLVLLALGAAFLGFIGWPHVLGGHNMFGQWLAPVMMKLPESAKAVVGGHAGHGALHAEWALMGMAVMVAFVGLGIAWKFYTRDRSLPGKMVARFPNLTERLTSLWGVDAFYEERIVKPLRNLAENTLLGKIETGVIEGVVNGSASVARRLASGLRVLQDGSIQTYLTWMVAGTLLLLLLLLG